MEANVDTFTYEFEDREAREMAFHNIVKWHGSDVVEKGGSLELNVQASQNTLSQADSIIKKHLGRLKPA